MKRVNYAIVAAAAALLLFASCDRSHMCYCEYTGSIDTIVVKEYRGYTKEEAQTVCMSDNHASDAGTEIECTVR